MFCTVSITETTPLPKAHAADVRSPAHRSRSATGAGVVVVVVVVSGNTKRYIDLPKSEHQAQVRRGEALRTCGPMLISLEGVGSPVGAIQTAEEKSKNATVTGDTLISNDVV